MNSLNDEDLNKINKLKQKLYSRMVTSDTSKSNLLRKHNIDIPTSWDNVKSDQDNKVDEIKVGEISSKKETVEDFLNDKFKIKDADNLSAQRATKVEEKIEKTTNALRLAQAELNSQGRQLYPNLKKETPKTLSDIESTFQSDYHPDFNTVNIGLSADKQNIKDIPKKEKKSPALGLIVFMLIFFFFIGASFYTYINISQGTNIISTNKIDIKVTGPVSVKSGEVVDFVVDITNNNNTDLILSDLIIQYPSGSKSPKDRNMDLNNERIPVGTIRPGETVRQKNSVIFFGEQNVKKNIKYSYEFNINDSSTVFRTEKDVGVFISGSPISVIIENIKEINNNQELTFDIEVKSNSEEELKNIQLNIDYPFGFRLLEATPKPIADNNTWSFDSISPLSSTTIRLKGKFIGEVNVDKNFRFTLGIEDSKTKEMLTVLSTQDEQVAIRKPFVITKLLIDGDSSDIKAVDYDRNFKSDLIITNNLKNPITDVIVEVMLGGVLINRMSVNSNDGFYNSNKDIIFWDKSLNTGLTSIPPGESRELSFNIATIVGTDGTIKTLRKATSDLTINVKAQRLNESRVSESVLASTKKQLRLKTDVLFTSNMGYEKGVYPSEVDNETVFKYIGNISNTANPIKNVTFIAKLPPNSTWKNSYSPNIPASAIKYNQSTREISINLGEIESGTGLDKIAKEFYFNIGFIPTLTQTGQYAKTIIDPTITATDGFTNEKIQVRNNTMTTDVTVGVNADLDGRVK